MRCFLLLAGLVLASVVSAQQQSEAEPVTAIDARPSEPANGTGGDTTPSESAAPTATPTPGSTAPEGGGSSTVVRLENLATRIAERQAQIDQLGYDMESRSGEALERMRERYDAQEAELERMQSTFELLVLSGVPVDAIENAANEAEAEFNWQQELVTIVEPLFDSLKNLTQKPRERVALRARIDNQQQQLMLVDRALERINNERATLQSATTDTTRALDQMSALEQTWLDRRETFEQELLHAEAEMQQLLDSQGSVADAVWPATRRFLLGRGLTLVLAVMAAALAWFAMRGLWKLYNKYFVNKEIRRNAPWYRLLDYSYYLLNIIVCVIVALAVLYLREDGLLLALAVLLLAGAALGLRNFLPSYIRDIRLLLNLGNVREDERVIHNGLPWQVMRINIQSVLRNPELDGIVRLPLSALHDMVSRPIRQEIWYPSSKGDALLMPDGSFARVLEQTPELVQLSVMGGMIESHPTTDFYATPFRNLTRDEEFGIAVSFGLDYSLQDISLTEVPRGLEQQVREMLHEAGHEKVLKSLLVELNEAGDSSLNYLIFATFRSEAANSYFALKRLMLQGCVRAANIHDWGIPFPQMVVHQANKPHVKVELPPA